MQFCNVHRLRRRSDGKPRNIVAKFVRYADHEAVRSKAIERFKEKKDISVYQQYPIEINNRRKEILPKLFELKRQGYKNARVVGDKLYIGQDPIDPSKVILPENNQMNFGPGPSFNQQYRGPRPSFMPPPRYPMNQDSARFRGPPPTQFQSFPRGPPPNGYQGNPPPRPPPVTTAEQR